MFCFVERGKDLYSGVWRCDVLSCCVALCKVRIYNFILERGFEMQRYEVEITGITPLLQNMPGIYGFNEKWVEKTAKTPDEKEAYKKLYTTDKGKIYQPSDHIEGALVQAGKKLRVKGAGKSTYSKLFGSMVNIPVFQIEHVIQDFDIFSKPVVNPSTKGRIMCHRPKFDKWVLRFPIEFEDEIVPEVILEALTIAGKYVGIGDWRPDKKGKFGKFQVTSFKGSKE